MVIYHNRNTNYIYIFTRFDLIVESVDSWMILRIKHTYISNTSACGNPLGMLMEMDRQIDMYGDN